MPSKIRGLALPARIREKVSSKNSRVIFIFSSASCLILVVSIVIFYFLLFQSKNSEKILITACFAGITALVAGLHVHECTNIFSLNHFLEVALCIHIEHQDGQVIFSTQCGGREVHHLESPFVYLIERDGFELRGGRVFLRVGGIHP